MHLASDAREVDKLFAALTLPGAAELVDAFVDSIIFATSSRLSPEAHELQGQLRQYIARAAVRYQQHILEWSATPAVQSACPRQLTFVNMCSNP